MLKDQNYQKHVGYRIARFFLRECVPLGVGKLIDEVVLESILDVKDEQQSALLKDIEKRVDIIVQQIQNQHITDKELEVLLNSNKDFLKTKKQIHEQKEWISAIENQVAINRKFLEERLQIVEETVEDSRKLQLDKYFPHLNLNDAVRLALSIRGSIEEQYRLEKELGQGGLAKVWSAYNLKINKKVALKVLHEKEVYYIKTVERFVLEAALAGAIKHPNIVEIYNFGGFLQKRQYFIEMEYLEGLTLKEWCLKYPWKDHLDTWLDLLSQLCKGLKAIHEKHLVHRDLKPGNIMIVQNSSNPCLKILDFGAVKNLDAALSLTQGDIVGTPKYMSPEQFDTTWAAITPASDLYSLGVICYEIFTGTLPFIEDDIIALHKAKMTLPLNPPKKIRPDLPEWLNSFIIQLLEKEPTRRLQNVAEVAYLLEINSPQRMNQRVQILKQKMIDLMNQDRQEIMKAGEDIINRMKADIEQLKKDLPTISPEFHNALSDQISQAEAIVQSKEELREVPTVLAVNIAGCPNLLCQTVNAFEEVICKKCGTKLRIPCPICKRDNYLNENECQYAYPPHIISFEYKAAFRAISTASFCCTSKQYNKALFYLDELSSDAKQWIVETRKNLELMRQKDIEDRKSSILKELQKRFEEEKEKEYKRQEAEKEIQRKKIIIDMEELYKKELYVKALQRLLTIQQAQPYLWNDGIQEQKIKICNVLCSDHIKKIRELLQQRSFREIHLELEKVNKDIRLGMEEIEKEIKEIEDEIISKEIIISEDESYSESTLGIIMTKTFSNGAKYEGNLKNGLAHGYGICVWPNGERYEGEWKDDKRSGHGIYTLSNGDNYEGEWVDDKMNGKITCTWSDGSKYEGEWLDDLCQGQGTIMLPNGEKYLGEFKEYSQSKMVLSKGTKVFADGGKYDGDLINGIANGYGICVWPDGESYVGEWKDERMSGYGTMTWHNGDRYEGEWLNDRRNGQGTMTWHNGDRYEGEWKNKKRHGYGTMTWHNGDNYVGEWLNDRRRGQGTMTWHSGDNYVGEWKRNKLHGQGTMTYSDGTADVGRWENDLYIGN